MSNPIPEIPPRMDKDIWETYVANRVWEKGVSYIIRKNEDYYEAINGGTGKIDYGGADDAGNVDGTDKNAVTQAAIDVLSTGSVYVKSEVPTLSVSHKDGVIVSHEKNGYLEILHMAHVFHNDKPAIMIKKADSTKVNIIYMDTGDSLIIGGDGITNVASIYDVVNHIILKNNPRFAFANTGEVSLPVWWIDVASANVHFLYEQQGTPEVAQKQIIVIEPNPSSIKLNNYSEVEKISLKTGTSGNRGVIKIWDVTANAYKYVYMDDGAWVISDTEPS